MGQSDSRIAVGQVFEHTKDIELLLHQHSIGSGKCEHSLQYGSNRVSVRKKNRPERSPPLLRYGRRCAYQNLFLSILIYDDLDLLRVLEEVFNKNIMNRGILFRPMVDMCSL